MTLIIDIHALQTVPPSLINRDDTGAPKTAVFGGVPRQRVSSQAWKRAIRNFFEHVAGAESIGKRSRNLPEVIIKKAMEFSPEMSEDDAVAGLKKLFKATGSKDGISLEDPKKTEDEVEGDAHSYPTTKALLFLSPQQIERAARAIVEKGDEKFTKSEAQGILDTAHSIDMAMFGRMLADVPTYNIDAAVQVAHAIGVHESEPEFDYFTAVDDVTEDWEETGAAMIGTVQMMSSTLYRFASVNVEALAENLGDVEAARQASALFVRAFIESMPTGKQNTFANNTLPELVYVAVRDTRSVSLVNAFEEPVACERGSRVQAAVEVLANEETAIEDAYGMKPLAAFVVDPKDYAAKLEDIAHKVTVPELTSLIVEVLASQEVA
ncbi:type I-E CRISPR-associated protein Cas7/Cse4/CasC [Mobiluncus curtisii]|uniref:Type I-E CRISPR-associated protein Cas7/Cse4/CasC n=1 Tax=Mobiluncus curtisii TaxID=2051 RepID=A0A7Y0UGV4_9ACTO|nr:type I-E CRISPR-associated protein Cas7/Cse4/CasC [Mobiluncus curtisii]EFL93066.1 CRISPR system CASCADE complex protein CasC [Mobiluncus curtisii subsp. curtisii ATCC 35241]MCU9986927.1 type I-E CRISPR-associated protein Cas7/Cse4/CasC [Mobiluncus curtisii]MCU9999827.1 type I-E CRISPR-associated protein Cas7/Cse4/CasC [Mobiluncus curtisii]MCV0021087.1 type I-E CRISPR-associated protein Cas7/Cse4/CasC [Mobiluncus curtisii]NMW46940.1 type I-E CRISPR-associated protein Cas7/Cse4/CasC [Mobilunc